MSNVIQFRRPKPRTLAEIFIERRREAMTMQLRAELVPAASEFIDGFMAGMELEQRFAAVMLNIEERV